MRYKSHDWLYKDILRRVKSTLNRLGIEYWLVGSIAYDIYINDHELKSYHDVDILIPKPDKDTMLTIYRSLQAKGFQPLTPFDGEHWHYRFNIKGIDVDIIFPYDFKITDEMRERTKEVYFGKKCKKVRVIPPEDLIILYLLSGRETDTEKVKNLLNLNNLDFDYLKQRYELHKPAIEKKSGDILPYIEKKLYETI